MSANYNRTVEKSDRELWSILQRLRASGKIFRVLWTAKDGTDREITCIGKAPNLHKGGITWNYRAMGYALLYPFHVYIGTPKERGRYKSVRRGRILRIVASDGDLSGTRTAYVSKRYTGGDQ